MKAQQIPLEFDILCQGEEARRVLMFEAIRLGGSNNANELIVAEDPSDFELSQLRKKAP